MWDVMEEMLRTMKVMVYGRHRALWKLWKMFLVKCRAGHSFHCLLKSQLSFDSSPMLQYFTIIFSTVDATKYLLFNSCFATFL
jgi:hypothetical protein